MHSRMPKRNCPLWYGNFTDWVYSTKARSSANSPTCIRVWLQRGTLYFVEPFDFRFFFFIYSFVDFFVAVFLLCIFCIRCPFGFYVAFKSTAKYTHNKHVYVHLYEFNFNGTKYIFELFGPLLLLVLGGNQSNAILKPLQCDQPYRINGDVDVCYFVLFFFVSLLLFPFWLPSSSRDW